MSAPAALQRFAVLILFSRRIKILCLSQPELMLDFICFRGEEHGRISNYLSLLKSVIHIRGSVFVLVHILFLSVFVWVEGKKNKTAPARLHWSCLFGFKMFF